MLNSFNFILSQSTFYNRRQAWIKYVKMVPVTKLSQFIIKKKQLFLKNTKRSVSTFQQTTPASHCYIICYNYQVFSQLVTVNSQGSIATHNSNTHKMFKGNLFKKFRWFCHLYYSNPALTIFFHISFDQHIFILIIHSQITIWTAILHN